MKKALLFHGWEGTSQSHWFPWLKSELEQKWYSVIVPSFPDTNTPIVENQVNFLKNLPELESFWKGDILIGHSLGSQVWLQYIQDKNATEIDVIFVAPSYNNLADELWEDRLDSLFFTMSNAFNVHSDFRLLKKQKNNYTVLLSDNDPYINSFSAREYYGQLDNIKFVEFEWKGHFSSDIWLLEFPELLEYVKTV